MTEKKEDYSTLIEDSVSFGVHLSDMPFVPEELGFKEILTDNADGTRTRIYAKDGYSITRVNNDWVVLYPGAKSANVFPCITNLFEAITCLRCCGMKVSPKDHDDYYSELTDKVLKELQTASEDEVED